MDYQSNNAEKK